MRVLHRYLGFFLAGIMAVYAISGVSLIFRKTDYLKRSTTVEKTVAAGLSIERVGEELKIKGIKESKREGDLIFFEGGQYDQASGQAVYTVKALPTVLKKMTDLHKATTQSPLFFFNIFFGAALLFFVLSAFWMFLPGTDVFKKGLWYTAGGIVLTLIMLFV